MQTYSDIQNLVEVCKDVFTYQPLFLPHSIVYISIRSFAIYFAKECNFIKLGVNPLDQITLLTICCSAAACTAFQDDTLPCYFVGVYFVCINASPGHKLIFQTTHCMP